MRSLYAVAVVWVVGCSPDGTVGTVGAPTRIGAPPVESAPTNTVTSAPAPTTQGVARADAAGLRILAVARDGSWVAVRQDGAPPSLAVYDANASKIADLLQHDWVRWGGGLYAAAFLREFTDGHDWAHLDIAGPAFNSGGAWGHWTPGGTGFAVATLVEYARGLAEKSS